LFKWNNLKGVERMLKYLSNYVDLFWYQRLYLRVYDFYLNIKERIFKGEVLVYKDKNEKGYIKFKRNSVLIHRMTRNKNKLFKRWDNEYEIY
jgi:hypothetical protein